MSEWERIQVEGNQTVVIVTTHKTGDKVPAALVMDQHHGRLDAMVSG